MYNTFRIKPYLVQIHGNIVLFTFFVVETIWRLVFVKHHHTFSSLGEIKDHFPSWTKKNLYHILLQLYTHTRIFRAFVALTIQKNVLYLFCPPTIWITIKRWSTFLAAPLWEKYSRKWKKRDIKTVKSFFFSRSWFKAPALFISSTVIL